MNPITIKLFLERGKWGKVRGELVLIEKDVVFKDYIIVEYRDELQIIDDYNLLIIPRQDGVKCKYINKEVNSVYYCALPNGIYRKNNDVDINFKSLSTY